MHHPMSATVIDDTDGIVTVKLTGKLSPEDLAASHATAGSRLRDWSGGSLLILADGFEGWTREGNWEDLGFQTSNDGLIHRMAIVGDDRWTDLAAIFTGKGLRPFPIEFFKPGEAARAREWLQA